ncbi:MAG: hypothetical protein EP338_09365 [Bacteroidetes bacterium]|nr:MAG: hypothetical protein EP338_09365 [Bacteroidota bacterium]
MRLKFRILVCSMCTVGVIAAQSKGQRENNLLGIELKTSLSATILGYGPALTFSVSDRHSLKSGYTQGLFRSGMYKGIDLGYEYFLKKKDPGNFDFHLSYLWRQLFGSDNNPHLSIKSINISEHLLGFGYKHGFGKRVYMHTEASFGFYALSTNYYPNKKSVHQEREVDWNIYVMMGLGYRLFERRVR